MVSIAQLLDQDYGVIAQGQGETPEDAMRNLWLVITNSDSEDIYGDWMSIGGHQFTPFTKESYKEAYGGLTMGHLINNSEGWQNVVVFEWDSLGMKPFGYSAEEIFESIKEELKW